MSEIRKLYFKDLKKGDVLLCRGKGLLSDLIVLFDGGKYSHAAFFDGEQVVQATLHGIVRESIDSLKEEEFVDVYRFVKDGDYLGEGEYPAKPVVSEAEKIVSEKLKYATDHLILLALLTLTRKIPLEPLEKKLLRVILDHATEVLFKIIDEGKTPMVCSETVYTIFQKALPENKYKIEIEGVLFKLFIPLLGKEFDINDELEVSRKRFMEAWKRARFKDNSGLLSESIYIDPVVASCVTPHDLETSKNLDMIGRFVFGES